MHCAVDLYIVCSVVILTLHLLSSELIITKYRVIVYNVLCKSETLKTVFSCRFGIHIEWFSFHGSAGCRFLAFYLAQAFKILTKKHELHYCSALIEVRSGGTIGAYAITWSRDHDRSLWRMFCSPKNHQVIMVIADMYQTNSEIGETSMFPS